MSKLKQRMYGLVPYNISPIQQGIQFGHAVVEYGLEYGESETYQDWAYHDKTFIILNGGTTNKNEDSGTLNQTVLELHEMDIPIATFHEPDLGDQLTAVVFLVDERVYDYQEYPEFDETFGDYYSYYENLFGDDSDKILAMREFLSRFKLA